jgi:beta-phosphoglucomutase family hydrolase
MRDLDSFDAVLFDLDGVVTSTADQHYAAWKDLFDEYLHRSAERLGVPFEPFQRDDYNRHVDGLPRYDGVRNLLASRSIALDEGDPEDLPTAETVHGLGNRKNDLVNKIIEEQGVTPYPGSVALLHQLRERGVKTAIVSSSRNCRAVLGAAGITELFDARVDGEVAAQLGLPGKPAPDTFLAAAQQLGVSPERAVVIEDALSGVEAGRKGAFGLVIGVDRVGQAQALHDHGADRVVSDLAELVS